jgi:PAS domain-containing protein
MTVADGSVMRAANVRIELAYRFAPIVGAVLIVIGLVFAVFRGWPGIVIGVVGAAVSGYTLYRASVTARRSHEDAAAELERQNRDLWQHARSLEAAKRESEAVLSAVRAHLMLIDGTFRIQSRYSSELEGVFHQRDLGNENFVNVLQRILSERMFKTARDYLALLFDSTRKERVVLKVNPLDEVEVTSNEADGVVGVRYLNFDFRRIVEDGAVSRVLVAVEDITDRVVRERQLRESEQHKV